MATGDLAGQAVFTAARLTLRPLQLSDTALLELHAGDERIARMTTSIPHPLPPGAAADFVERSLAAGRSEDVWAMDGRSAGLPELVGVIGLERMERGQSELGYWVARPFWSAGIASEAVASIIAANPHSSRTLFASVFQDNPASAQVLARAGFEYLSDAETFSVARGSIVATWTYLRKLA